MNPRNSGRLGKFYLGVIFASSVIFWGLVLQNIYPWELERTGEPIPLLWTQPLLALKQMGFTPLYLQAMTAFQYSPYDQQVSANADSHEEFYAGLHSLKPSSKSVPQKLGLWHLPWIPIFIKGISIPFSILKIFTTVLKPCFEQIPNKHKKHGRDHSSVKVGTLGGHNPLCLKSYKIRIPMKNFKKPNFKMK